MGSDMTDNPHYVSTVFACDTSADNRYVKCDFNQCDEHSREPITPEWILNTHKNVKILERHVGQKISQFVSEYEKAHNVVKKASCEHNVQLLEDPLSLKKFSKIVIFFNLRDQQAELGLWIQSFLDAAAAKAEHLLDTFCTITMSFSSRLELMRCIGRLKRLRESNNQADVMAVLSCHSSNQGQVFSCTPTYISADANFEEFCSLHDFVRSCQDVLQTMLKVIHISSCFTLKLDNSLVDWPVCYTWYRKELNCTLCGSTNEVYETGSQVADLYLILSVFVNQSHRSMEACFDAAVCKAIESDWPDLANEMGLSLVNADFVEESIKMQAVEDKVTPPRIIFSPIHVLLVTIDDNIDDIQEIHCTQKIVNNNREDRLLLDAILQNLNVRRSSDLNARFSKLSLNGSLSNDEISQMLQANIMEDSSREVFFVFIGGGFGKISTYLYEMMREFCSANHLKVYGMHFQNISPMSWRALSLHISDKLSVQTCCAEEYITSAFAVTGSLNDNASCVERYPVILYLIHLAVGENGLRRLKKSESEEKDRQIPSRWSLVDVYMETSFVLSGLSRACDLKLLSPDSIYMRSNSDLQNRLKNQTCVIHGNCSNESNSAHSVSQMIGSSVGRSDNQSLTPQSSVNTANLKENKEEADTTAAPPMPLSISIEISPHKRKHKDWIVEDHRKSKFRVTDCHTKAEDCKDFVGESSSKKENISFDIFSSTKQYLVPSNDLEDVLPPDDSMNLVESDTISKSRSPEQVASSFAVHYKNLNVEKVSQTSSSLKHSEILSLDESYSGSPVTSTFNDNSRDLPLMANVDDVLVKHYILDLDVDFETKIISGTIILFIEPAKPGTNDCNFQMCLDSTMVTVDSAVEIPIPSDLEIHFHNERCCCMTFENNRCPVDASIANSSLGKNCTYCDSNSDTVTQCDCCSEENRFSCGSSCGKDNCYDDNLKENTVEEGRVLGNGGITSHFDDPLQNNHPSGLTGFDSKNLNAKSPLEESGTKFANCKIGANADNGNKYIFKCRHCQYLNDLRGAERNVSPLKFKKLAYSIHGWCIRVWKEGEDAKIWPRCVKLWYHTSPDGQSIMWAKDQDGKDAVFTPGAYINNRSLMPCQEPPVAMSTWQAYFHVRNGTTVLMSGDRCPCKEETLRKISGDPGLFYYEMSMPLPSSTLALAIGGFVKSSVELNVKAGSSGKVVPVAMYAPDSCINDFGNEFMELARGYLTAAIELLGDYPFSRLDLVMMPRCFACMGLESPNLAFLSQSLLCGDRSMAVRIAHEIAHAWFGLLIGVKDWTEEWLSEGFATYLEERIQARAEKLSYEDDLNRVRLRQAIRYRSLKSELSEADENLKSLRPRPMSSGYVSAAEAIRRSIAGEIKDEPAPHTLLKGALIPSRKWTQVHYLKGYFLLYHLSQMVGQENFDRFLRSYVDKYRERLVSSEMFFNMFADNFKISTEIKDQLMSDWLESSGIPPEVKKRLADDTGAYVSQVNEKFLEWKKRDIGNKRCRTLKQKRKKLAVDSVNQSCLTPDQIILLLEKLLERDTLAHRTLKDLQLIHSLNSCNAEIRHRWCELIVKHKYCQEYGQVRRFLVEDQGMGIYLFGELLISEDAKQRRLANEVFEEIKNEMDGCTYQTVYEMLNGI